MRTHKLFVFIKLLRFPSVLMMSAFILLPILSATHDIAFSSLHTLPFILMLSGEIALNDCFDVEKDKINKPQRPLVGSSINIYHATVASVCVIMLGLLSGGLVYGFLAHRFLYLLAVTAILSFYNYKHPLIPLLKTGLTATATVVSLSFVYTYISIGVSQYFFLIAAFFFILGREVLMDIRDIRGDSSNNYKTVAVVLGNQKASIFALICFFAFAITAICMLLTDYSFLNLIIVLLVVFLSLGCYIRCIKSNSSKEQNKYVLFLWIPIVLMLFIQAF